MVGKEMKKAYEKKKRIKISLLALTNKLTFNGSKIIFYV